MTAAPTAVGLKAWNPTDVEQTPHEDVMMRCSLAICSRESLEHQASAAHIAALDLTKFHLARG